jgi:hypothetical protein
LKLKFDVLLSNFAFKFNVRRYAVLHESIYCNGGAPSNWAGAYTRPLFSST